jgi:hypothetical protein
MRSRVAGETVFELALVRDVLAWPVSVKMLGDAQ